MPRLATHMKVTPRRITIDGEDFPWFVTDEPVRAEASGNVTEVTLTIFVEHFESDGRHPGATLADIRKEMKV